MDNIINNIIKNPYDADNLSQQELEYIINVSADAYYNTKKAILEDNVYDILIDFLKTKFPKSKVLKKIGAKINSKDKVKLDYWMGSMDKIKPGTKELEKWLNIYTGNYILSDKLDGISALLVYKNNKINLYSRGTANEGLDITPLVKYLNLPSKIKENIKAIRGELIMTKNTFHNNWSKIMKNGRNTVSGLVNSKNVNPQLAIDTLFVAYEIIDPILKPEEQLILLNKLGFNTVHYKIFNKINLDILSEYFLKRRTESEFVIDGIIVTNNQLYTRNTKSNPEYAFAFKDVLEEQMATTTVIDIEWNISKDGLIKPVLILEPVNIGGVVINRVTAHNAKNIVDNKIGKGSIIKLIRSGDVIPMITDVIKPVKKVILPSDYEWEWNASGVDIILKDSNSNEMLIKNIYHFFSTINTKGLGEKVIEKLISANYNSVKKILQATEFINVESFKDKSSLNLINSIKKAVTDIPLNILMTGSNKLGAGFGPERCKLVLDRYPNLLNDYKKWSKEEFISKLIEIDGFDTKISTQFVSNFDDFIKFYNDIKDLITINKLKDAGYIKNEYSGLNICITGFRDSELESFLKNSGAKVVNTVTSTTNLLIVKDKDYNINPTSKVKSALKLNIKIITKSEIKM